MEVDHVFLFIEKPELVARVLGEFGLTEGSPNVHPGQGTACTHSFFHNAYLESAWVTNEPEIKPSPISRTKLWERSQHSQTNYSFGLCFRTTNPGRDSIK
jgi:Glyoxalase-like domain